MAKIYTNTKTLDRFISDYTDDPTEAEYLILGSRPIDITPFNNLKGIFRCGVGTDNLPDTSVPIALPSEKTKHIIYSEVATFTVSQILTLSYNDVGTVMPWSKNKRDSFFNKKVLVVGTGKIGSLVVSTLETICKDLVEYDLRYGSNQTPLEDLIKEADIVTLHVPHTEDTHEFIDPTIMKDDAILINSARGQLVNEDKLYEWLHDNPKAQAAFDVFWKEPYEGKLLDLPNFVRTPHVASTCNQFIEGLYADFVNFMEVQDYKNK